MQNVTKISQRLRPMLAAIAAKQGYKVNVDFENIPTQGANFTSYLFRATITTPEKPDLKLFAKVANISDQMRKENISINRLYTVERHFYTKLINDYKKLENDYDVPQEHRLIVPKCYLCDGTYLQETVVLENIAEKGYTMHDRFKSVDWEYAIRSIEELTKFHALSFALAQNYPKKFQQYRESVYDTLIGDCVQSAITWKDMIKNALHAVSDTNKERLVKFIAENVTAEKIAAYKQPSNHPVLTHGDFRSSNLMHKKNGKGQMDMILVDFQTMNTGNPLKDLIYFIITSTDEEFRSRYHQKLIENYYEQLCTALQRFHLDPKKVYPRKDFDVELRELMPFGLHVGLYMLQIVTVQVADAPKFSEDELGMVNIKTSEEFKERLNGMINDYVKWGII